MFGLLSEKASMFLGNFFLFIYILYVPYLKRGLLFQAVVSNLSICFSDRCKIFSNVKYRTTFPTQAVHFQYVITVKTNFFKDLSISVWFFLNPKKYKIEPPYTHQHTFSYISWNLEVSSYVHIIEYSNSKRDPHSFSPASSSLCLQEKH